MSIIVEEEDPGLDAEVLPFEPRDVKVRRDKWVTQEFGVLGFLGRGKFGEVKQCVERKTGRNFAAKFISAPGVQEKKEVEHEINIMKKLQHPRLLQLYDAFASKTEMCLILELILGGELFDRVIDDDFVLTERACVMFMRQICEGVAYMHKTNIIHLDMKPENILCLTKFGNRIKIIDFGLAREYEPGKDLRVLFGTPEFMAPEIVNYETIGYTTDMWSVGVIAYVLLSGLSPFMGDNDGDTMLNVMKAEYDFSYNEFADVSDDAKDLIRKLLIKDKEKRLTAAQSLEHPWLRRRRASPKPAPSTPTLLLSKRRLRRFVIRRKWQKVVNAMIALKRMGVKLTSVRRRSLQMKEQIFSWKAAARLSTEPVDSAPYDSGVQEDEEAAKVEVKVKDAAPVEEDEGCGVQPRARTVSSETRSEASGQQDLRDACGPGEDSAYSTTSNDDHDEEGCTADLAELRLQDPLLHIREEPARPRAATVGGDYSAKVKRKPAFPLLAAAQKPQPFTLPKLPVSRKCKNTNIADRISKFQNACVVSSSFTDRKTKVATAAVNRVKTEDKATVGGAGSRKKNKRRPPPLQLSFSEDDTTDASSTSSTQAKSTESLPRSGADALDLQLRVTEDLGAESNGQESSSTLEATPCNDTERSFTFCDDKPASGGAGRSNRYWK